MNATSRLSRSSGDHRAFVGRRAVQRGLELRPPFQCIGALRGLDFGIGLDDLVAFSGAEALNCGQLAFKAETGLPLLLGANADVGDNWLAHVNLSLQVRDRYSRR